MTTTISPGDLIVADQFPKRSLAIGVISLPFWYAVFVSQGGPPKSVAVACALTLVLILIILYVVWRRANREEETARKMPDENASRRP